MRRFVVSPLVMPYTTAVVLAVGVCASLEQSVGLLPVFRNQAAPSAWAVSIAVPKYDFFQSPAQVQNLLVNA